jgi:tubulin polyglutamylase TTLL4
MDAASSTDMASMFDCEPPDAPSLATSSFIDIDKSAISVEVIHRMPEGDKDPIAEEHVEHMEDKSLPIAPVPKPKRQIMMLPSVFEGKAPVILFTYTQACLAKQRPLERMVLADINGPKMYYSHTDAVHEYNAVINSLRQGGLYRVKSENRRWSLLWSSHPPPELLRSLKVNQKTNHFPGSWHLGRKDLLWRNISRMHRRFGRSYHITPLGYVLPKGAAAWETARARQPDALWIWKPCSQSCGRGIKVLSSTISEDDAKDLNRKRGIVQRYIHNPLLINGYKFDLRVYVVVVSYEPLKVYFNDEGLVRMATEKYSLSSDSLDIRTMHLTNYSVNKLSPLFVQNKDGKDSKDGAEQPEVEEAEETHASKWCFTELRSYFQAHDLDFDGCFDRIKDVVIKTLLAVEPQLCGEWARALENEAAGWGARGPAGAHPASCFETYGFDVMIDDELKPWLLEVNICPSLSSGSPLDKRIKTKLVADTLTLVGIRPTPSLYRVPGNGKRSSADMSGAIPEEDDSALGRMPCLEELAKRKAMLAVASGTEAIALFDEFAWDIVLKSHDEDMRCGGLERIFPTAESAQYTAFFSDESYANLVLRKWHEAGGDMLFKLEGSHSPLPPWVPRKVCFSST